MGPKIQLIDSVPESKRDLRCPKKQSWTESKWDKTGLLISDRGNIGLSYTSRSHSHSQGKQTNVRTLWRKMGRTGGAKWNNQFQANLNDNHN